MYLVATPRLLGLRPHELPIIQPLGTVERIASPAMPVAAKVLLLRRPGELPVAICHVAIVRLGGCRLFAACMHVFAAPELLVLQP